MTTRTTTRTAPRDAGRPLFRLSLSYRGQQADTQWLSRKNYIWLLIALAAGLFVRVNLLAAQSLWNDEGTSVALASTSLPTIIASAAHDIHPPLYYILLHYWVQLAGNTEFSLRFLSVLAGVLLIAVTFRVAREFFDQDVAVIAAVLSALNAFQTYYAQETRMYIWVTLFSALSVWMMALLFNPPREGMSPERIRRRRIAGGTGYVVATLAAMYTNYYAFTLVLFENLAFLVWLVWAWRGKRGGLARNLALWVGAQIVLVLAYVPWLFYARASLTSWPGISEPMSLADMGWRVSSAFVTASDMLHDWQGLLVLLYLVFFVGGLLPSRDLFRQSAWGIALCALWAVVPLLAMYAVSLSRPAYNPKFLLLATPGFLILVGRGVSVLYPGLFLRERTPYAANTAPSSTRVGRQVVSLGKLFLGGLFAAGTVLALQQIHTAPELQRDDYRGMVNYINALATPNDAVIVDAPGQLDVVRYYYRGAAELKTLPVGRPLDASATSAVLAELLESKQNLFGIFWATEQADPEGKVDSALGEGAYKAADTWHGDVRLVEYAGAAALAGTARRSVNAQFGDEIQLDSLRLNPSPAPGGHIVPLELAWRVLKTPQADYKLFVHLLDADGHLISQYDAPPSGGRAPTSRWRAGDDALVDRVGLVIPPGTPPGDYALELGLYRADTGVRLPVRGAGQGGDASGALSVGTIRVEKTLTLPDALFLTQRVNAPLGNVELLGYNLERSVFTQGEFIPLVTYWQARAKPPDSFAVQLELLDQGNNVIASAQPFGTYPPSRWDRGEIVRDVETLAIPANALPGEYRVVATGGANRADVTNIQVR